MDIEILEALAVSAELTGTELSKAAVKVMCEDLERYPKAQVLTALNRCRREVRRLTLSAILERLDDGRPGPEEAWSMLPHDEATTAVMTEEMSTAFGVANPLIQAGDMVAARMAFRESYTREVQKARDEGRQPVWRPSLGHDVSGREGPLMLAAMRGRLSYDTVQKLIPHQADNPLLLEQAKKTVKRI